MRVRTLATPVGMLAILFTAGLGSAAAQNFKIAHWNAASGFGRNGEGYTGGPGIDTICDCGTTHPICDAAQGGTNAWATGYFQYHLVQAVQNDLSVVAMVLNEAWSCATPQNVATEVGWTAQQITDRATGQLSGYEKGGVAILARYGYAVAPEAWKIQDRIPNVQDERWVVHAAVWLDSGQTQSFDVYGTHIDSTAKNGQAVLDKTASARAASTPHVILGDLNTTVAKDFTQVCAGVDDGGITMFTESNSYRDTWWLTHLQANQDQNPGYTASLDKTGNAGICGNPQGAAYKRVDFALFWGAVTAQSVVLFGNTDMLGNSNVSGDTPSDHYGLIAEYAPGACGDAIPPTSSFTAPLNNAQVSGTAVPISITASDNINVTSVELKLDGNIIKRWIASPYTMNWDSTTVSNAAHTFEARAYDACGNPGPSSISVTVLNTNTWTLAESFTTDGPPVAPWTKGQWSGSSVDNNIPVTYTGGQLKIGDLPNLSGTHYNGIWANAPGDFSGASAYVQIVHPAAGTDTFTMLTVGKDSSNYYRVYVNNGFLVCLKSIGGTKTNLGPPVTYDAVQHAYVQIRHASGQVLCEAAPDNDGIPGNFVQQAPGQTWSTSIPLATMKFELKAGTSSAMPNAGSALYDNFKAVKP